MKRALILQERSQHVDRLIARIASQHVRAAFSFPMIRRVAEIECLLLKSGVSWHDGEDIWRDFQYHCSLGRYLEGPTLCQCLCAVEATGFWIQYGKVVGPHMR